MSKIYLCVNSNNVVTDIMVTEYEMKHPERIPWDIADYALIGKKLNRCGTFDICNKILCDNSCTTSDYTPTTRNNILSRLEFRQKFTLEEFTVIYNARNTDIVINIFLDDLAVSEIVDLDYPATQNGIGYLYNAGYITYERMLEILG